MALAATAAAATVIARFGNSSSMTRVVVALHVRVAACRGTWGSVSRG